MKKSLLLVSLLTASLAYGQIPGTTYQHLFTDGSFAGLTKIGTASTLVPDRTGAPENAVQLNGDYMSRASFDSRHIWLSFWIKTTTNDAIVRTIIDHTERTSAANTGTQIGWYTYLENGKIGLSANFFYTSYNTALATTQSGKTGYYSTLGTSDVADGEWHHIVITAEGTIVNSNPGIARYTYGVYVDGTLENSQVIQNYVNNNNANIDLLPAGPFVIGNISNGSLTNRYEDAIDDIRFYGSPLSAASMAELGREGTCTYPLQVTSSDITETSATITWDKNILPSSRDLSYVESGGAAAQGTIVSGIQADSYLLTSLKPNTSYDVYVRANCSGSPTNWSAAASFTTLGLVYVNASATGANNGTSWEDAFTNLSSALAQGSATKRIWVAAGTYTPHASDRKATFNINNASSIYGGFAGNETEQTQRNPKTNITILSGDLLGNDNNTITDAESTRQDNSFHVVTLKGNVQTMLVDGFTISGGNANGTTSSDCATAAVSQFVDSRGGAIYAQPYGNNHRATGNFINCILENNSGTDVAVYSAFYPCGISNLTAQINFKNCIVRDNFSGTNAAFFFNSAGAYNHNNKSELINCLFYNNTSTSGASCLYIGASNANGVGTTGLDVNITNSTFSGNTGIDGNVITMANASVSSTIKNSIIYGNGSATPLSITTSGSAVTNSFIEGGQQGGTDTDPIFEDAGSNDYRLSCTSTAIDAGDDTGIIVLDTDVMGNNRIKNTIDLGAIEFSTPIFPSITAVTKDISVELDETGNAIITIADIDGGSGASCGTAFTLSIDITSFTCADVGANTVTLTATETVSGAQSTATAVVTVEDSTLPIAMATDLTLTLDASGNATLTEAEINNGSSDNCTSEANLIFSLDKTAFTCADLGENTVVLTVTDEAGNESTVNATVTIEDTTAPTVIVQDVTMTLGADGTITVAAADIDNGSLDNCTGGEELIFSLDQSSFGCDDVGMHTVTLTVTDVSGNEATATASVTITSSIVDEIVTVAESSLCPGETNGTIVSTSGSMTGVSYSLRNSADNTVLAGPLSGTGQALNFSTGAVTESTTFNIYAVSDAPQSKGLDFDGVDDRISVPIDPSFNYQNGYSLETWVNGPLTSSTKHFPIFHVGTSTTSDIEVYLQNGTNKLIVVHNRRTSGGVTYSEFPTPPVNTWYHLSVNYDGSAIKVYYDGVAKTGTIGSTGGGLLTKTNGAGLTVGYVSNSHAWASTLRNFTGKMDEVRIWNTARTATEILGDMNACLDGNESGLVAYYNLEEGTGTTATDLVGGFNGTLINMDGATDWITGTQITCSSDCGFQMATEVTVSIADMDAPTAVAQDLTIQLDASGTAILTAAEVNDGSTDQCSSTLTLELDKTNFTCDDLGNNIVTLTVTDEANNQSTATATILVEDKIIPTVLAQNLTVNLDATGSATITAGEINNGSTDNCTLSENLVLSADKTTFTCADLGTNTVTLTVTDSQGNQSSASSTVTVADNRAPTVVAQNVTLQLDASGSAALLATDVNNGSSDNCTSQNDLILSLDQTNFTCAHLGANTVTLTVTDANGNEATGTAMVTIEDNIAPTAMAQDLSIRLDASNQATATGAEVDNGSSDNCGTLTFTLDKSTFDETNLGPNQVVLTVDDGNGNTATANATITVLEFKTEQTITFEALTSKQYGDAAITLDATASSNLPVAYELISGNATLSGTTLTIIGVGTVTVRATQSGDDDFQEAPFVDQSFEVTKAPLTITAEDKSITYGAPLPAFTKTFTGFVNGEDESALTSLPSISSTATNNSGAGTYPISLSFESSKGRTVQPDNYEITLVNATLTIDKAALTVTADAKSMVFGGAVPPLTMTYAGFVNGETVANLTTEPGISTVASSASNAGEYAITLSGGVADNYAFALTDGTLSITKAPADITITDLVFTADGTAKSPTVTTTPAGLNTTATYNGSATAPLNAGTYDVVVTIDDQNYMGSATATLIINAPPLGLEPKKATIEIYPNPVATLLNIHLGKGQLAVAHVFDLEGREIGRYRLTDSTQQIDVSALSNGIYYLTVIDENAERIARQKIIVNK